MEHTSFITKDTNYIYCRVADAQFRKVLSPESWEVCMEENGVYQIAFTVGHNVDEAHFPTECRRFLEMHLANRQSLSIEGFLASGQPLAAQ